MIPGISSSSSSFPHGFVTKVNPAAPEKPAAAAPGIHDEPPPAELAAPATEDHETLGRDYKLFDLATRQFAEILPRLESANLPVE